MKKVLTYLVVVILLSIIGIWFNYFHTSRSVDDFHSAKLGSVPVRKVAVVLGTSKYLANGQPNLYFQYRIDAALELFEQNKVKYFLVSGDNSESNYNEPKRMRDALVKGGVPLDRIVLDYAGFRTFDSMVRAKKVFNLESFIVVSQKFHNERALYIAKHLGLNAFGYDAREVDQYAGFKTSLREYLARVKMMLDLYILKTKPRFLGEQIDIGNQTSTLLDE